MKEEQKNFLVNRKIVQVLKHHGINTLTEASKALSISIGKASYLFDGTRIANTETIQSVIRQFKDVSADWLINDSDARTFQEVERLAENKSVTFTEKPESNSNVLFLPVTALAGQFSYGGSRLPEDHFWGFIPGLAPGQYFGLQVFGDCMEPVIGGGDSIIVGAPQKIEELKIEYPYLIIQAEGAHGEIKRLSAIKGYDLLEFTCDNDEDYPNPFIVRLNEKTRIFQIHRIIKAGTAQAYKAERRAKNYADQAIWFAKSGMRIAEDGMSSVKQVAATHAAAMEVLKKAV